MVDFMIHPMAAGMRLAVLVIVCIGGVCMGQSAQMNVSISYKSYSNMLYQSCCITNGMPSAFDSSCSEDCINEVQACLAVDPAPRLDDSTDLNSKALLFLVLFVCFCSCG